jgi:hypothetical protein
MNFPLAGLGSICGGEALKHPTMYLHGTFDNRSKPKIDAPSGMARIYHHASLQ